MAQSASQFRHEFDQDNKILLIRVEGRLTDESVTELYQATRNYSTATDASMMIVDFSSVTEFAVSTGYITWLAQQEPAMPHATTRPRIFVVPQKHGFGLCRMFQLVGEEKRPLLQIVHTLEEALTALHIPFSPFESSIALAPVRSGNPA